MKKALLIFLVLTLWQVQPQAQAKIWRSIDLTKFPNTQLTVQDLGFRQLLFDGIRKGRVKVYETRKGFADFTKRIPKSQLKKVLQYYDNSVQEMVELRSDDYTKLILQELYDPSAKKYQIKAITLESPDLLKSFVIKYSHFKKYLNKIYKRSRRKKDLMVLKAYWQSPENKTLQTSVPTALENRKFLSKIVKTEGLNAQVEAQLKKQAGYQPKSQSEQAVLQAPFLRIGDQKIRATLRYAIDLKAAANAPFYQKGEGIVKVILDGIKKRKIKTYKYVATPQKRFRRLKRQKIWNKLVSYNQNAGDTLVLGPKDLYKLEIVGYWDINLLSGKSAFKINQVNLLIPKGTNVESQLGDLRLTQLKYKQVAKYLKRRYSKAQKRGKNEAIWVNPKNNNERMSFAEALEKGLDQRELQWFANQQDSGVLLLNYSLIQLAKKQGKTPLSLTQAAEYAQKFVENYGKK